MVCKHGRRELRLRDFEDSVFPVWQCQTCGEVLSCKQIETTDEELAGRHYPRVDEVALDEWAKGEAARMFPTEGANAATLFLLGAIK